VKHRAQDERGGGLVRAQGRSPDGAWSVSMRSLGEVGRLPGEKRGWSGTGSRRGSPATIRTAVVQRIIAAM